MATSMKTFTMNMTGLLISLMATEIISRHSTIHFMVRTVDAGTGPSVIRTTLPVGVFLSDLVRSITTVVIALTDME